MTARGAAGTENVQGEVQKKLDVISNGILLEANEWGGNLAALASEEMNLPHSIPTQYPRGEYLLLFDPLDGSSNIDVNIAVGTIFSVLRCPPGVSGSEERAFLQPGTSQAAAGFAVYGPTTVLVLTVGDGVHAFTLDRETYSFVRTHADIRIPEDTQEFAINVSNMRRWEPPVKRYIDECLAGKDGRLRLMYEANPMALIVEQTGGAATDGKTRILELQPHKLHQRVAVILGSKNEVERVTSYHAA